MRYILLLLLSLPAFAAPKPRPADDANVRPPFVVGFRGGFVTESPDRAVIRRWEHQTFESFQLALSGFYSFPRSWKEIQFFAGPEFYYRKSAEEIAGQTYTATLDTDVFQFMLTGGVDYRPWWLGGDWGSTLATAFMAWGQKTTALDAQGMTQDLGTEDARDPDLFGGLGLNVIVTLYYDYYGIRPQLVLETNSTIGLGLAYAF